MPGSSPQSKKKIISALVPILVLAVIWFSPVPAGLSPQAWKMFAIFLATIVGILALIAGTIRKTTHEVLTLQRTETAEPEEPFFMGKLGSSTMPHKRNPQVCENVIALTRNIRSIAPVAVEAMN